MEVLHVKVLDICESTVCGILGGREFVRLKAFRLSEAFI